MAKRNTKEIILFEALKLFSDRGYEGVTMRDIASEVGIMQSSLYKHYESKQAIFDCLVEKMKSQFNDASAFFQLPMKPVKEMAKEYADRGNDFLMKLSISLFRYYLNDPHATQFRKMLSIERYSNPEADKIYREIYIDAAISYQTELFNEMIQQGYMQQADPEAMALQFYSPIYLLQSKYVSIPEREDEAIVLLEKHVAQFSRTYEKRKSL